MAKYYIGLANTFHDSALAIVNSEGEVIFAEATERFLQSKRAVDCVPDRRQICSQVIKKYCPPNSEFVVAKTWSGKIGFQYKLMFFLGLLKNKISIGTTDKEVITKIVSREINLDGSAGMMTVHMMEQTGRELYQFICEEYPSSQVKFVDYVHHFNHAANACYGSPFNEGVCAIIDGYGEGGSLSYFHYKEGKLKLIKEVRGIMSLGFIYYACTHFCGFDPVKGEEWKVMGLAPYGQLNNELYTVFKALLKVEGLDIKYSSKQNLKSLIDKFAAIGSSKGTSPLAVADLAYTMQFFYSETVTEVLNNLYKLGLSENLVLGGGCGLNSAYNGEILDKTPFKHLYVPSAPADDGNAIGAALLAYYEDHPQEVRTPKLQSPYLGSSISKQALENLKTFGKLPKMRHLPQDIYAEAAVLLTQGKLLGWVQGQAEFGPRALGNRSILAAPYPGSMKPGAWVIDVAADAGRAIEGTKYTSIDNPIYTDEKEHTFYVVNNSPSLLYRESSEAVSEGYAQHFWSKPMSYWYSDYCVANRSLSLAS